jgi:2-polyprenyl-3-methyl-5-hydroxy-6-metoxy-1,4-benzoquinol methylase
MEKVNVFERYIQPIISDNRDWRKDIPEYDKYFDSVEEELSVLPKVDNVISDKNIVSESECDVCGHNGYEQLFCKYGFKYVTCSTCNHIYVKNRLIDDTIISDYRSGNNLEKITHKIEQNSKLQDYTNQIYQKYLHLFAELGLESGKLLDIGTGAGNFLSYCKNNSKYELYANELNEDMYPGLKEIVGDNLLAGRIEDCVSSDNVFDIITLWGVLEHLIDPVSVLIKARNLLKKNGYILALIPNINSRAFKILGVRTPTLNPKVHLQMFTEDSFKCMCNKAGLEIVKLFGELPVIDLMYDYIDYSDELIADIIDKKESYYHVYLLKI